jgi:hypothetical protein
MVTRRYYYDLGIVAGFCRSRRHFISSRIAPARRWASIRSVRCGASRPLGRFFDAARGLVIEF